MQQNIVNLYDKTSNQKFASDQVDLLQAPYSVKSRFNCMSECNERIHCALVTFERVSHLCSLYSMVKSDQVYSANTDVFAKRSFNVGSASAVACMSNCTLPTLCRSTLANTLYPSEFVLQQAISLSLSLQQISVIGSCTFNGLSNMQTLNAAGIRLTSLEASQFQGDLNLTHLNLNNNQLTYLNSGIFSGLFNLQVLDLSSNKFAFLNATLFTGLHNLQQLNLNGNQLTFLDASLFRGLASLQFLYVFTNQLSYLDATIFYGLTSLATLDLQNNMFAGTSQTALTAAFSSMNTTNKFTVYMSGNPIYNSAINFLCGTNSMCTMA